jgi:competence protein ComEC
MSATLVSPPPLTSAKALRRPAVADDAAFKVERLNFAGAPLLFASLAFAAGILLATRVWFRPALSVLGLLLLAGATLIALRCCSRIALLPLLATWTLLGVCVTELQPQPAQQLELRALGDGSAHSVTGEITSIRSVRRISSVRPFSDERREEVTQSLDLRVSSVENESGNPVRIQGGVRLSLYSPVERALPVLHCGDRVMATATLREPERYRDPGVWDGRAWLLSQGIGATGSANVDGLTVLGPGTGGGLPCFVHNAQQGASERLVAFAETAPAHALPASMTLTRDDAAMLSAMVTGDRSYLGRGLRAGFERTGSFHLLVVSGLHLGLFAGFVFACSKRLRLPGVAATITTIALAFGYALLTGFGQPVQRAFWMVTLYLVGRLLYRERSGVNAVGFAALGLLTANPCALLEPGFQMTLLSVIAIAGVVAPLMERTFGPLLETTRRIDLVALDSALPPRLAQFRVTLRLIAEHLEPLMGRSEERKRRAERARRYLAFAVRSSLRLVEVVIVSGVIELTMALPMAAYFHRITTFGLAVNLLIVPALIFLLPAAFLMLLVLLLIPKFAFVPAAATAVILHLVTSVVHVFSSVRFGDLRVPGPTTPCVIASLALLAFSVWCIRQQRFGLPLGVVALIGAAALAFVPTPVMRRQHVLEVTAIDVGQGDALLVVAPDGRTLLVDAGGFPGGRSASTSNFDMGEDVVSPYLWSRHIRRLDAVALTHAHSDHMGGMPAVLRNFRPRELWIGKNPDTPEYDALLAEAQDLEIPLRHLAAGDGLNFGDAEVRVLAPARDYQPGATAHNNDSLVLHVANGRTSALLEGDAEAPSEERMLQEPGLAADLLKVGHHGSKTSTIPPFLRAVAPHYAVVSVGMHNSYHHPRWETLMKLQDAHALTYRTDLLGLSTFYLDGRGVEAMLPGP